MHIKNEVVSYIANQLNESLFIKNVRSLLRENPISFMSYVSLARLVLEVLYLELS